MTQSLYAHMNKGNFLKPTLFHNKSFLSTKYLGWGWGVSKLVVKYVLSVHESLDLIPNTHTHTHTHK
jgi:hypothetical protein